MTNIELYEREKRAIMELFEDQSVDPDQCYANLQALMDEIQDLLNTYEREKRAIMDEIQDLLNTIEE